MKLHICYLPWLAILPVTTATFLDYASLQQSFQRILPAWTIPSKTPAVTLPQGKLLGVVLNDDDYPAPIEAFLGIPYVLPPIGNLRFALPVPVAPSNQTIETYKYGPRYDLYGTRNGCPGPDVWNEDCLTANVFRPIHGNAKLPVAVYIHGGAFNRGTAKMHNTASMLAWSAEPFIAVSFNYRLGALGFLNSALTAEIGLLNVGLKDQISLLEWLQENIASFGGDPDNVTIMGLSAGAHSTGHHIMNINAKKTLFHKAIIESGGPTSRAVHPHSSQLHEVQFRDLVKKVGCEQTPDSELLACLRNVPSEELIEAQIDVFAMSNPSVRWAWQPVIDNDIISRRPLEAWQSGEWNKVPILTGFNHNEGTVYVPMNISTSGQFTDFFGKLLPQITEKELETLNTLYPDPAIFTASPYVETRNISVGAQYKRVEAAYGQYAYVCPVRHTASLGSVSIADPAIYLYHWATNRTVLGGANHADQMWYEGMDPVVRSISPTQDEIAGFFHGYITSFIVSGDPNVVRGRYDKRPDWPSWGDGDGRKTMLFGMGNDERAGGDSKGISAQLVDDTWAKQECEFWWKQSANYED